MSWRVRVVTVLTERRMNECDPNENSELVLTAMDHFVVGGGW